MEAGHQLGLRLRKVERRAVRLGGRGHEVDQEGERLRDDVPVPEAARLRATMSAMRNDPASMITPTQDRPSASS